VSTEDTKVELANLRTAKGRIEVLNSAANELIPQLNETDIDGNFAVAEHFADLLEQLREEERLVKELGL
jgi:ABC-type ATPase with predicted acetyltransferase domain